MAGYVVGCLLKAALLPRRGFKKLPDEYWHHDPGRLAVKAGLVLPSGAAETRGVRDGLALI
jgi:hypothetical protein